MLLKNESEDGTYNSDLDRLAGSKKFSQLLLQNELNNGEIKSRNIKSTNSLNFNTYDNGDLKNPGNSSYLEVPSDLEAGAKVKRSFASKGALGNIK